MLPRARKAVAKTVTEHACFNTIDRVILNPAERLPTPDFLCAESLLTRGHFSVPNPTLTKYFQTLGAEAAG